MKGEFSFVTVDDSINFDEMSKDINLVPSRVIRKGEMVGYTKQKAPFDVWSFSIKFDKGEDISSTLEQLLQLLISRSEAIKALSKQYKQVRIDLYLRSEYGQLGIEFTKESFDKLAQLGIGMDIHILSFGKAD
ncbi:DUF4279 domain-containing protein [Paenibacillus spiritus]|uniref:DUF4279 domain-containing protein n=1 Tax=Paenibacillus spiritus TaxID=2496557 RepID=UPI00168AE907|nr:DUF4279 domain-containing protein [Paenibacillus spiritus]